MVHHQEPFVQFSPGQLTYNRVSNEALLDGWGALSVNSGSGFVTFGNANWTPLSGGGELLHVVFDVAADATEDTLSFGPLTNLNDGALPVSTVNALFGPDYDVHTADQTGDQQVDLSELLRVIQFFNSGEFHCQEGTEDSYAPGPGDTTSCSPHAGDYNPQDWSISLSELLRLIQFFNSGGYQWCPEEAPPTEDAFCPGPGTLR